MVPAIGSPLAVGPRTPSPDAFGRAIGVLRARYGAPGSMQRADQANTMLDGRIAGRVANPMNATPVEPGVAFKPHALQSTLEQKLAEKMARRATRKPRMERGMVYAVGGSQ